jgi:mRNA-degrading endonuclease RelE of RelBE toxin-antitoxin system
MLLSRNVDRAMTPLELFVEPEVHKTRKDLPGHVRQRVKHLLDRLADEPRPSRSHVLDTTGLDVPPGVELRRWRLARWRVIYAVHDREGWIWVLAIRQRPPYDYEDLGTLVARLS